MGIWCAHGEGKAVFPDPSVQQRVTSEGLAPIRYDCTPLTSLQASLSLWIAEEL